MNWDVVHWEVSRDTLLYNLKGDDEGLSFIEVAVLWTTNAEFVDYFVRILQESPFAGYFWEVKPVTHATASDPFEFVLINGASLTRMAPDPSAFSEHLVLGQDVASFFNLGGDARLIAPMEVSARKHYGHLASFVRHAPGRQVRAFWQRVGEEYHQAIGSMPRWLSTAGLGVPWLHARIDQRPKYYRYMPYRSI